MSRTRVSETRLRNPFMASSSSSSSKLPWLWCFEVLADFMPVDTVLLRDLMSRVPEFSDQLSGTVRERVALRGLEQLLNVNSASDGRVASLTSGPGLEAIDGVPEGSSCEEVLRLVLNETEMSEILQQEINQFILHKRDSLPRFALKQLKDAILDGTHPFSESTWKRSGLANGNQNQSVINAGEGDPTEPERMDETGDNEILVPAEESVHPLSQKNGKELLQEGQEWNGSGLDKDNQSKSITHNNGSQSFESVMIHNNTGDNEIKAPQENLSCLVSRGNGKELLQEQPPGGNSESVHRCLDDDHHADGNNTSCLKDSGHRPSDLKSDTVIYETRNETLKGVPPDDSVMKSSKRGRSGFPKEVQVNCLGKSRIHVENDDHLSDAKKVKCDANKAKLNTCEIQHNMSWDDNISLTSNPVISQRKNFDDAEDNNGISVSHPNVSKENVSNETEDRTKGCRDEGETSSKSGGDSDRTLSFNLIDTMLIAAERNRFLNSRSTYLHDSHATSDQKVQRICCMCGKGGQLLICSVNCCPLVVHETCLGSPADFDDKGNFHCPFCSCERANNAYFYFKKKAALARKNLATFTAAGKSYQQKSKSRSTSQEPQSRKTSYADLPDKNHDHREQKEIISNQLMQVVEHQQEAEDADRLLNGYLSCSEAETSISSERNNIVLIGENPKPIDNKQSKGVREDQQPTEPLNACCNDDLHLREENAFAITETPSVSVAAERGDANMPEERHPIGGEEDKNKQEFAYKEDISADLPYTDTGTVSVSHKPARHGNLNPVLQQQNVNPFPEPSSQPNVNAKETSENENDSDNVSSSRFQRPAIPRSFPVLSSRRKKVPWTVEEEKVLVEGVQRFSSNNKNVSWKKILEFGCRVFQESRNPSDLKDKWRKMGTKGDPRAS